MSERWKARKEIGSPSLMRWFARTCLFLGPAIGRVLLLPITAYFFLTRATARRQSRDFLQRALHRPVRLRDIWRHFYTFSQVVLDRAFLLGNDGKGIELIREQPELLLQALDRGRGCVLLGSHLGSFEASRAIKADRPEVALRLVMDRHQSPAANAFLEALNPELVQQVLDIGGDTNAGLAILNALQDGALVAMLADRVRGREKTIQVQFMGATAHFPAAPHEIAVVTGAPVVVFFGLHVGPNRYRLVFESMPTSEAVPRRERAAAVQRSAQWFAERLEYHARREPFNWFNFYDFWSNE